MPHIDLLKLCIKENIPYIIFEDDIEIIKSIDFKFEDIVKKDLDVFWLIFKKNLQFSIYSLAEGKKLIESQLDKVGGLSKGLDWKWNQLKNTDFLRQEEISDKYLLNK